jgi:hypothetical protein
VKEIQKESCYRYLTSTISILEPYCSSHISGLGWKEHNPIQYKSVPFSPSQEIFVKLGLLAWPLEAILLATIDNC